MTALVWHRSDLRLEDNAAVSDAARARERAALGVCVLPSQPYAEVAPGVPRWSPRRLGFWLEAIHALQCEWEARGSALAVAAGDAAEVVPELAERLGAHAVHTAPCLAFDERRENDEVRERLARRGIALHVHHETTLLAAVDLPFAVDALPDVFSTFRRAVEHTIDIRAPAPPPAALSPPAKARDDARDATRCTLDQAEFRRAQQVSRAHDPRSAFPFSAGRTPALERLRRFCSEEGGLARYKETRDGLLGVAYSSKLSPWLATGALSPREVHAEVTRYEATRGANDSTRWLVFELLWRDYFHFWVHKWRARAFSARGVLGRTPCGAPDRHAFDRWRNGETGEPFVDAAMRELAATGYLSNRARQNAASWLTRTARVDWRWGAAWFESQLVDHDVGPNWGNWQYVAGVGNDPRNRVFDVAAQAERYDPDGAYRRTWASL